MSTSNGATVPASVAGRATSLPVKGAKVAHPYSSIFAGLSGKAHGLTVSLPPCPVTGRTLNVSCPVGTECGDEDDASQVYDAVAQCDAVAVSYGRVLPSGATIRNAKTPPGQEVADAVANYL